MQPRHTTKNTERLKEEGAPLAGRKVAILVADGFEQSELVEPRNALKNAGATTHIVSPVKGKVIGWKDKDWGDTIAIDVQLENARPDDYDALLLPGGVINPDNLRANPQAVQFVRKFFEQSKPVAAICHGPWTLIDAGVVEGRQMTSYHSIRSDLLNAGAKWIDKEVVVDNGLVTSRQPSDIPAFNRKMIEEFAEGKHSLQKAGVAIPSGEIPGI
ncbi:MAG: type 1 glutamine amidotransferase [Verrucomicrobia bacterium]|nr:type 1 glutamine amidotransferase [Verrucomicrobiota bacterium]